MESLSVILFHCQKWDKDIGQHITLSKENKHTTAHKNTPNLNLGGLFRVVCS